MRSIDYKVASMEQNWGDSISLNQIIELLEQEHEKEGDVICEIRVNNMLLSEADEKRLSDVSIKDINQLSIVVSKPVDLFKDSLESISELLKEIRKEGGVVSKSLRIRSSKEGFQSLEKVFKSSQWLIDALIQIRTYFTFIMDPNQDEIEEKWLEAEKSLTLVLNELLEAFEKDDIILIADILEYDFDNSVSNLYSIVENIKKKVEVPFESNTQGTL